MPQPNILLIMTDQMKATASHLYGNSFCETPSMARLADDGVLFDNAITPHPLCCPARVALWTGQYPHATGARRNQTPMPADATHAFKLWHEMGYHCGLIGKNHCFETEQDRALFDTYCETGHGDVMARTRGMEWVRPLDGVQDVYDFRRDLEFQNPIFRYGFSDFPLEDYSSGLIAAQTTRFLEQRQADGDPFALWVSLPDPHEPYETSIRYASQFTPENIKLPPWREGEFEGDEVPERNKVLHQILGVEEVPREQVYGVLAAYYGMVRFVDDALGQILDALDATGLRENTIVVFCADHGDFAGEHAMQCKGGVFYDCLTRVPLIVSWPGVVQAGVREESPVNLVDIVPTLLHLQGEEIPRAMQGEPLPTVTDALPREAAFSEYGAGGPPFKLEDLEQLPQPYGRRALMESLYWREAEGRRKMVRTQKWKFVHDPMGDCDELYDLANDPWELTNVAGDASHAAVISELRARLADWSIRTEDAQPVPLPEVGGRSFGG